MQILEVLAQLIALKPV